MRIVNQIPFAALGMGAAFTVLYGVADPMAAFAEAEATVQYKEELTRPTGTNWGFPGYRAEYEVSDPEIAEILQGKNGEYRIHLIKPGDVVVKVTFYSGGEKLEPEYYLFHVTGTAVDDTAFDWGMFAVDVIRLTNEQRAERGLKPLRAAFELSEEAAIRAREVSEVYSHTRPDGSSFSTVFEDGSYETVGENLQAGASTPEEAIRQWMNSPSHRENILSAEYEELGVGYIYAPESKYKHYWVQLFRR